MKKGLLTVLLASLVLVGCQNYDDQFDDLNAQISALKSQVDGLSSLSGQVSSLGGTISGLQAGVAAAQAAATAAGTSADAATAAANGIAATDLSGLEASLATLATDVAAVQASLATAATAAAVTALQAEIDAIESDLDELLTSSNIYATDVSVTSAATLDSALALGNKLNVLNASLTITGYASMDYTKVQTLVDRVNTTTGNIVYSAYSATGTEIKFNNLTSAANITMTQPNGYSFPKLTNAGTIDLKDDYETTVTNISFPVLTTATAISTDATGDFKVEFLYATNVDFGAMVTAPSNTISITTKKGATLDLSKWVAKTATGTYQTATVTLNGPASWTNGTAAGTFASSGLPGNTVGAHDGAYTLTNVATVAIHNFRGDITLNTGITSFTGNNIVRVGTTSGGATITAATDLETVNITQIRDNDTSLTSANTADLAESAENTDQDLLFTSAHAKLTSVTVTGKTGDVKFTSVPVLATVDLTSADAFDVMASGNASMSSWTDASSAEDRTFINNDLMTSVNLSATTKLSNTTDYSQTVEVSGNAELASLTLGMSNISTLNVTDNDKLATIAASSLAARGTSSQTSVDVDIHQNALVATAIQDTKEAPTATVVAGAASDLGSITTDSGMKTLDTYLASAMGATTGTVSVWFDTVSKLETQAAYGGAFTDVTTSLTAPAAWDDTTAASNAALFGTPYTAFYAYAFDRPVVTAVTATTGARTAENRTYAFDVGRNNGSYSDKLLATNEGITITYDGGNTTFKQGDTYNGSTVTTVTELAAYINADTTLDGLGINLVADRSGYEKTLATINYTTSSVNGLQNTTGTLSTAGNIWYTVGTTETGTSSYFSTTAGGTGVTNIRAALEASIQLHNFGAVAGTNANQLIITRMISGGTTTDRSPIMASVNVTPYIDAESTSTTAKFLAGEVSNTAARTSGNFAFTVTEETLNGLRITLSNTGSVAFSSSVSLYGAAVSNTAILTENAAQVGEGNLLVDGTNITAWTSTYTSPGDYVTAYTDIAAGTLKGQYLQGSTDDTGAASDVSGTDYSTIALRATLGDVEITGSQHKKSDNGNTYDLTNNIFDVKYTGIDGISMSAFSISGDDDKQSSYDFLQTAASVTYTIATGLTASLSVTDTEVTNTSGTKSNDDATVLNIKATF